jgi:hypothetical protein
MPLEFTEPPSLWSLYPRILASRKSSLVRESAEVPRIKASLAPVRIDRAHLRAYRESIGAVTNGLLPIAYPHVLASGLHLAVLACDAFPVKLFGLVHIRNRIGQNRALAEDEQGTLQVSIEGFAETDKGQEFTLRTEWRDGAGQVQWDEDCVFLARRKRSGDGSGPRAGGGGSASGARPSGIRTTSFRAPMGLGRSYGLLGGDLNPIHLSDLSAKLFGFKGAIAHGMWSMARVASDLEPELLRAPCELAVAFRQPVFLPAWLMLEQWPVEGGVDFKLRDGQENLLDGTTHLTGSLRPAR